MNTELVNRAIAAWMYHGTKSGTIPEHPSATLSRTQEVDGKTYVVLANENGNLGFYRLMTDGRLRKMRRWPKGLKGEG